MLVAVLDLHGFTMTHDLPSESVPPPRLTVPLAAMRRLGAGVSEDIQLTGSEETALTYAVTFRLVNRDRLLYRCDSCALCRPYLLDRLIRDVARAAAREAAVATLDGLKVLVRRSPRVAAALVPIRKRKPRRRD